MRRPPPRSAHFPYATLFRSFLDFFAGRGHRVYPSSSLIPYNDPTVLLTTAGMQQFITFFTGRSEEHTSELQSRQYLVCRLLLEKKNIKPERTTYQSIMCSPS